MDTNNSHKQWHASARELAAINVANAFIETSGTTFSDTHVAKTTSVSGAAPQPTLAMIQDMSRHSLEGLEQGKSSSYTETYLRSLAKEDLIQQCLKALQQIAVLEHSIEITNANVAQQRLFFDGMRDQLLSNGHSIVEDMSQAELLRYCVELLGGFVHE